MCRWNNYYGKLIYEQNCNNRPGWRSFQYAEGICGFNRSFTVYIGDGQGFERKEGTSIKNEIAKDIKARHKSGTRGKKDYGCGIPGSTGGLQKSVRGSKLEEYIAEFKETYSYHYPSFQFRQFKKDV